MIKNRFIPFRWLPASYGLSGPAYDEAEAYYRYDGYDLAERLAVIRLTGDELEQRLAELQLEYGIIDELTYDLRIAKLETDPIESQIAMIDVSIRHGMTDPIEGAKDIATLKGEPWIRVIDDGINLSEGVNGYYFEFDWNDIWITQLREAGYVGASDEEIVQAWFQEVCRIEASASMGDAPVNAGVIVS